MENSSFTKWNYMSELLGLSILIFHFSSSPTAIQAISVVGYFGCII